MNRLQIIPMLLAALALVGRVQAVTIMVDAEALKNAEGQAMTATGLVILVASTNDATFGGPTEDTFVTGDDIEIARWDLSAFASNGVLSEVTAALPFTGGWDTGDPLQLYWFPTLTTGSIKPGPGAAYGQYRHETGLDGSEPWVTPGEADVRSLRFYTADAAFLNDGGASPSAAGIANLSTPGEPGPQLTVTPASHDFGTLGVGFIASTSFEVINTGAQILIGSASVGAPFAVDSGSPFNLGAGQTGLVVIAFSPLAEGPFLDTLVFTSNAGVSSNAVSGAAVAAPVANFTAFPTSGDAPLAVAFSNQTTGTVTSYFWDFGDNESSNESNPNHLYAAPGSYAVSLTAFGPGGTNTQTRFNHITVTQPPLPDTEPPSLVIVSPTDFQTFANPVINVTGTATDESGVQGVTVNAQAAVLNGSNWSRAFTLSPGTNTITVVATDNSPNHNARTQGVHAILLTAPLQDTNAPVVTITSPSNLVVTTGRFLQVAGTATDNAAVASVIVTNSRGGAVAANLNGAHWTADSVMLLLGTNHLVATATDLSTNRASAMVTVVRIHTNYVNTTLCTKTVQLVSSARPNSDTLAVNLMFNGTGIAFDPRKDTVELLFGDYEATLSSNKLVGLKYKGKLTDGNTLTFVSINFSDRSLSWKAGGFTLAKDEPFLVAAALGTNDLGPDAITFPLPADPVGKFTWAYGKQLPEFDLFMLESAKIDATRFQLTGKVNVGARPSALTSPVCIGIGPFDETLATNGWTKGAGNVYTYTRPSGYDGKVAKMTVNLDLGTWTVQGAGANLSFLQDNPTTDVRLEIGEFAASYPATFSKNKKAYVY